MGKLKEVTDDSFDVDVLKSDKPVLVDFWADWCAPCRLLSPILEEIQAENPEKISIVKLNVDEQPNVPREYGVMRLPTMNLYKDGEVVKQISGAKPKSKLLKDLEEFM
ncbi:thioredoxin [Murinocardiopsis flavida]|uniref:Thioredoxin n=1 Tax=Murinocardiopsis flavida TaxID=645275 RepID=A0A2P8DE89_9ACTN|nr:thioredoxin [Murinocardiopsis flavida]PSK95512.1 thioredoxin [Murinocardiopsis flavida]